MDETLRWGILGAGIIANRFADALTHEDGHELVAVGSKTPERAREFAERHGGRPVDYDALLNDPTVDVVYVATTHNFHHENARAALEQGKHVLVEKPITVNANQLRDLMELARDRGFFLMEAMWTRFLPSWQELRARVASGAIGDVRHMDVLFGGIVPPHYEQRLKDPHLAGGVSLDMGVYPLAYACHALGELPTEIASMMRPHTTGVDEIACYLLRFPSGCLVTISTSFDLAIAWRASLHGTKGSIDHPDFPHRESFTIRRHDGRGADESVEEVQVEHEENTFVYQVREVARCVREGALESDVVPLGESLAILDAIDGMRATWGLRYPFE